MKLLSMQSHKEERASDAELARVHALFLVCMQLGRGLGI
jgi:hypothetical protein